MPNERTAMCSRPSKRAVRARSPERIDELRRGLLGALPKAAAMPLFHKDMGDALEVVIKAQIEGPKAIDRLASERLTFAKKVARQADLELQSAAHRLRLRQLDKHMKTILHRLVRPRWSSRNSRHLTNGQSKKRQGQRRPLPPAILSQPPNSFERANGW